MSYVTMDHAGWLEANAAASRRAGGKPKKDAYGRVVGWHAAPERLNPFQARVADIIGITFGGIYNAPINWHSAHWSRDHVAVTTTGGDLATIDYLGLTRLVFLCHDARIRGDIAPATRGLRLGFWHRDRASGLSHGHPSLLEAVGAHRRYVPADHRLHYRHERDSRESEREAAKAAQEAPA